MTPEYVTSCSVIIDDIVLPDGRTFMNTLGGSGTHALVGMRVWSDRLGYVAAIGSDFDPAHREALEKLGVDLRGMIVREGYPTARAWQLFEPDERRIEIFRTAEADFARCRARFEEFPPEYLAARGYHLHDATLTELVQVATELRSANPKVVLVWEPTLSHIASTPEEVQSLLPLVDLYSPDLQEAQAVTGQGDVEAVLDTLLAWGARLVGMRMGARGSLVATATGEVFRVPAVPTTIVDVTGAGDAYCGGFLVGLGMGDETMNAAARATVSASFALEQFGVPEFGPEKQAEAERRLAWALERIDVSTTAAR